MSVPRPGPCVCKTACDCSLEGIDPSVGPSQDLWGAGGSVSHWFAGPAVLLMRWLGRAGAEYRALCRIPGSVARCLLLAARDWLACWQTPCGRGRATYRVQPAVSCWVSVPSRMFVDWPGWAGDQSQCPFRI